MQHMKKYGFGFVGLGVMATVHMNSLRRFSDVAIVAGCDPHADTASKFAEEAGLPAEKIYSDYEQLVHDPDVDVIICVTPNNTHAAIIRSCIEAGKPFMAEKPFTRTFDEAAELMALIEQKPVMNMIGFSYRYNPQFRYAQELIQSGKLGKIHHVFIQYLQGWGAAPVKMPFIWRFDEPVTGTGTLGDLGSHMIDMARFLIGEFVEVSGRLATFIHEREDTATGQMRPVFVDDFASFNAVLGDEVSAVFQTSRNAIGSGNQHEAHIYGDQGTIVVSSENEETITYIHYDSEQDQPVREQLVVPKEGGVNQWDEFMKVLRGGSSSVITTVVDGYLNQQVMEAIVASSRDKKVITLSQ
jgi:predicted dehydrogenase